MQPQPQPPEVVDVLLEVTAWLRSTHHERIELGQHVKMPDDLRERYQQAFPHFFRKRRTWKRQRQG